MFYYQLYGLSIESEIEFPELISRNNLITPSHPSPSQNSDIMIQHKPLDDALPNFTSQGIEYQISATAFQQTIGGIGRFQAQAGHHIFMDLQSDAELASARHFILDSVLAAILYQRGQFVMTGGAIQTPRGAVLIIGATTSGKTTLLHQLRHHYPIISDTFVVLDFSDDGQVWSQLGYPELHMWYHALNLLNQTHHAIEPVRRGLEKYRVPIRAHFAVQEQPVAAIIFISQHNQTDLILEKLTGLHKISYMTNFSPYRQLADHFLTPGSHFKGLQQFARNVICLNLTRWSGNFVSPHVYERIHQYIDTEMMQQDT